MAVDKDFYNEASAAKLGWTPDWFVPGHTLFDRKLQNAIRAFQREHRLLADGMCGPTTYRRIQTQREAESDIFVPKQCYLLYSVKLFSPFLYLI